MTETRTVEKSGEGDDSDNSLLVAATMLLRNRRLVTLLLLAGALFGFISGMLKPRLYSSAATLVPQGSEGPTGGLAFAASQLGIRVPASGTGWGAPMYMEVLRSREVLEPIALDTVIVAEEGARRVALADLLGAGAQASPRRADLAVARLTSVIHPTEDKRIGAVRLAVTTEWPSVSFWIADQLLQGVEKFNLKTRQSQATAERRFAEQRADEAERALRSAEDRLQSFQKQNRILGSPELVIEQDRRGREVGLRQQVYTSLVQSREEARIREVRDTPVVTVLDAPRLPVVGEPRGVVRRTILGGILGGAVGIFVALMLEAFAGVRRTESVAASNFLAEVGRLLPRFRRRGGR